MEFELGDFEFWTRPVYQASCQPDLFCSGQGTNIEDFPHYCLGAHLARREITAVFAELLRRIPDIAATGEPVRLRSNFINGVKHLAAGLEPRPLGR